MRKALLLLAPLAVFAFLLFPPVAESAGLVPCGGGGGEPACTFCHTFELLKNVIDFFLIPTPLNNNLPAVPLIAVPFIIIGGLYLLVGGASPQLVSKGKTAVTAVVVGLILAYSAWVLINTFFVFIGVSTFGGIDTWYDVDCTVAGGPSPPLVLLTASPSAINDGDSSTIAWTVSNAATCVASGSWAGPKSPTGGSDPVTPASGPGSYFYNLECTGPGGTDSDSAGVFVSSGGAPVVTLTIEGGPGPLTYTRGQVPSQGNVRLEWVSVNTIRCDDNGSIENGIEFSINLPHIAVNSSWFAVPFSPDTGGWSAGTRIYRIICTDALGATDSDEVVLKVE